MLRFVLRLTAVAVMGAGLGLGIAYALESANPWWLGLVPLACAVWVLFTVYHGYLAFRWARWRLIRVPVEKRRTADLNIPADVAEPVAFDGVAAIDKAQHELLPESPDRQGAMLARGVLVAFLPVAAVLLAATQTVLITGVAVTVGLIGAGLACILVLLVLVGRWRNPADRWVQARTRAELLRREQYLRLAAVGPYLHLDAVRAGQMAERRVDEVRHATGEQLRQLLPPRSESGYWLDELWGSSPPALSRLRERALCYLHYRIRKQLVWFDLGIAGHRRGERRTEVMIKVSVGATAVIVAAQAVYHLRFNGGEDWIADLVNVPALVLPPVCALLLAIEELFTHRRLAVSYEQMRAQLHTQLSDLQRLLDSMDGADPGDLGRRFQATVLHTETALTYEVDRWIMLVQRDAYELEP